MDAPSHMPYYRLHAIIPAPVSFHRIVTFTYSPIDNRSFILRQHSCMTHDQVSCVVRLRHATVRMSPTCRFNDTLYRGIHGCRIQYEMYCLPKKSFFIFSSKTNLNILKINKKWNHFFIFLGVECFFFLLRYNDGIRTCYMIRSVETSLLWTRSTERVGGRVMQQWFILQNDVFSTSPPHILILYSPLQVRLTLIAIVNLNY